MQEQLKLFQKIEVIESTKQSKPGSIGYIISLIEKPYNILVVNVLFTKFGKSGKNRFSTSRIKVPLIDADSLVTPGASKREIEALIDRHLMARNADNRYELVFDSKIKVIHEVSKNLMDLDTWSFMAYISTISLFISGHSSHNGIYDEADMNISNIGHQICQVYGVKNLEQRLKEYIQYFDNDENRKIWLDKLKKEISICKQIVVRHLEAVSNRYRSDYIFLKEVAMDNGIKLKKLSIHNNIW